MRLNKMIWPKKRDTSLNNDNKSAGNSQWMDEVRRVVNDSAVINGYCKTVNVREYIRGFKIWYINKIYKQKKLDTITFQTENT